MIVVQDLMERLRPLVGFKGWDYCVLWKLSDNQRYIEWMGCCCAGAHQNTELISRGEELHHEFPHHVSQVMLPCRDAMFQHPTTKSCQLLSLLPSSIPLDHSGIHAQALISNVPRWLNFSNSSDSIVLIGETIGTRALIPVAGGLVELLVTKHVAEDQNVIEFVTSQCNFIVEQEAMINATGNMDTSISISSSNVMMGDEQHNQSIQFLGYENGRKDQFNHFHTPITPEAALENPILPYDVSVDRIRLCNSPMNFLQQFNYGEEYRAQNDEFFEGADHQNGVSQMESLANKEEQGGTDNENKEFSREKNGRTDSISDCSDQIDDDDEDYGKCQRRKVGKGQAKNLEAERKRRKKLNERLYTLRTLVPNITKLDKASILGDAISFVKELQRQAKELQDELEEPSNDEGVTEGNHGINLTQDVSSMNQSTGANHFSPGSAFGYLQGASSNGTTNLSKPNNHDLEVVQDKGQQMEPQVEVAQIDGNKFFVKVFCEFKAGGFVRLMEALNSLGFVVTNANVTRVLSLVSNVFQVEMKDSELVQADYVRDSLLELTRNPSRGWPDQVANASESCNKADYHHHHHHHHQHQHFPDGHTNSNYQPHHHNR